MYTDRNFKTKKELKAAVAAGEAVTYHQPFMGEAPRDGKFCVEGPHYPKAHTWYASCTARDGIIVSVK